jgi:hypothetical protein
MKIDPDAWYSEAEVAKFYRIGTKALTRRLNAGRLRYSQVGSERRLISGAAILEDLQATENTIKRDTQSNR